MESKKGLQLIFRALEFAADKHRNQRRKDLNKSPYINHPVQVASILCNEGEVSDPILLTAALLHDTIEDTETSPNEIKSIFGEEVLRIVLEVTDNKDLPKLERKKLQVKNAPSKSTDAKQLKLADKTSNLRDIVNIPPGEWDKERKLDYLKWSQKVADGLRGSNPKLEKLFAKAWAEAKSAIDKND